MDTGDIARVCRAEVEVLNPKFILHGICTIRKGAVFFIWDTIEVWSIVFTEASFGSEDSMSSTKGNVPG